MYKILVIRLYFPLDALHVSDYISPSSGTTFISCTSHLLYAVTSGYCMRRTAYKFAPEGVEEMCIHNLQKGDIYRHVGIYHVLTKIHRVTSYKTGMFTPTDV